MCKPDLVKTILAKKRTYSSIFKMPVMVLTACAWIMAQQVAISSSSEAIAQSSSAIVAPVAPATSVAPAVPAVPAVPVAPATPVEATPVISAPAPVSDAELQSQSEAESEVTAPVPLAAHEVPNVLDTGHYINRIRYDKGPASTKVDTILHKKVRNTLYGHWRTPVLAHGHAFRDATLEFCNNDTLYSVTFTWADSNRYQKTGEYAFNAQFKALSENLIRSREAFVEKNVVRWDFTSFTVKGDTLLYHLEKLEFRDLNDNWLDAKQSFDNVPAEVFIRLRRDPRCGGSGTATGQAKKK
jgi:hypothetical protein